MIFDYKGITNKNKDLIFIAGPCVIESEEMTKNIAKKLKEIKERLNIQLIFKGSYDKANRTSLNSFRGLGTKIAENENAIGYASYGVYNQNKDKLFALKVDGIEPTKENILNGSYKIQRPLMFIKNSELSENENEFVNYIFSDLGKQIVNENGYIAVE